MPLTQHLYYSSKEVNFLLQFFMAIGEVHSELSRKPKMEFFEKITVFLLLTIFVTNSILHV